MFRALVQKRSKKGYRKKVKVDDLLMDDDALIDKLGGWTECRRCCVSLHWGCLTANFRHELLAQDKKLDFNDRQMKSGRLRMDHKLEIDCPHCAAPITKNCYVCWNDTVPHDKKDGESVDLKGKGVERDIDDTNEGDKNLLFRCAGCHRAAHYQHRTYPHFPEEDYHIAFYSRSPRYQFLAWILRSRTHRCPLLLRNTNQANRNKLGDAKTVVDYRTASNTLVYFPAALIFAPR